MMKVLIEKCTGCGECILVCPQDAIHMEDHWAVIDRHHCIECLSCQQVCSTKAIREGEIGSSVLFDKVIHIPSAAILQPQRSRFVPMIGAAILWTGREIIPRMATMILDIFEYRLQENIFHDVPARNGQPRRPRDGRGRQRQRQNRGYRNGQNDSNSERR